MSLFSLFSPVHRLDPIRVEVAVEDNPLVVAVLGYVCGLCPEVAHDHREHAVLPLTCGEVDVPVPEEEGECTPDVLDMYMRTTRHTRHARHARHAEKNHTG